jgi:hypothetical protein
MDSYTLATRARPAPSYRTRDAITHHNVDLRWGSDIHKVYDYTEPASLPLVVAGASNARIQSFSIQNLYQSIYAHMIEQAQSIPFKQAGRFAVKTEDDPVDFEFQSMVGAVRTRMHYDPAYRKKVLSIPKHVTVVYVTDENEIAGSNWNARGKNLYGVTLFTIRNVANKFANEADGLQPPPLEDSDQVYRYRDRRWFEKWKGKPPLYPSKAGAAAKPSRHSSKAGAAAS